MAWTFTGDVEDFANAAGEYLLSRPAENTIELGVADAVRRRGPAAFGGDAPLFGWWRLDGGQVASTFLQTPPFPGLLTSGAQEASIRPLAEDLVAAGRLLPGINAAEEAALAFAVAWQQLTAVSAEIGQRTRLFTDLANPTSNSLYVRLGYRPVEDRVIVRFKP